MSELLIAGGSGLIGSKLIKKLKQKNFKIVLLSTQKNKHSNLETLYWNPDRGEFPELDLKRFSHCINFCGVGIFDKRFTEKRKLQLLSSRIKPIQLLIQEFEKQKVVLPHFISASAGGFYPNIGSTPFTENARAGTGFISMLVDEWEKNAHQFKNTSDKVSIVRIGIVLSKKGGFLKQILQPMRYYIGAIPGSGKQIVSWIHIDDLCSVFIYLLENGIAGTFNATAPQPASLAEITRKTAKRIGYPLWLPPIPAFVLKVLFGKERCALLLTSQYIDSNKISALGFRFEYPNIDIALENALNEL